MGHRTLLIAFACAAWMGIVVMNNKRKNDSKSVRSLWSPKGLIKDDQPHEFGLIHVGKTGGVGLSKSLRFVEKPTMIIRRNPEWYHQHQPVASKYDEWIITIRDPIERIKSNYNYEHPANMPFRQDKEVIPRNKTKVYDCFHTVNSLATIGLSQNMTDSDNMCFVLARSLFRGILYEGDRAHFNGMQHFSQNFRFYTQHVLERPDIKLWAIRQEHMLEDINTIDRAMGGEGIPSLHRHDHMPGRAPVTTKYISPEGINNLCRVLCEEIQLYKEILRRAVNLQQEDIERYIETTIGKTCPLQTSVAQCSLLSNQTAELH